MVADIQKLTHSLKAKDLRSFVVFMSGPEAKDAIAKAGAEKGITIPMTFLPQGPSAGDVQQFKINPSARNTILVYNRHKVYANFVNVDAKSFPEVSKAAEEMLNK